MTTFPKIDRRGSLALWLQDRRRRRRAPLLFPEYPGLLVWEWPYPNPYRWRVYWSNTIGGPYLFVSDYWTNGASRQFAPDGGSPWHVVVGVDVFGNEVTGRSNAVRPDDAPMTGALLPDLLAYWALDEVSGDFLDASGNDITAYDAGFIPITRGATGKINSGASCEEFDQYLNAPINNLSGDFSISFWLKSSTTSFFTCLSQADAGYLGWLISVAPASPTYGISFLVYTGDPGEGGGAGYVVTAPEVIDGTWHHIVCVKNGNYLFIYKDGALADTNFSEFPMFPAPSDLMFFDNSTALGQTFVGTLDEIGIWQRALSLAEVGQLYNSGNGLAFDSF